MRINQDRGAACHSVSALGSSIGTAILCSEGAAMVNYSQMQIFEMALCRKVGCLEMSKQVPDSCMQSSSFTASSAAGVVGGRANLQADRNSSHLFGCLRARLAHIALLCAHKRCINPHISLVADSQFLAQWSCSSSAQSAGGKFLSRVRRRPNPITLFCF